MIEDFQHVCLTCRDLETSKMFIDLVQWVEPPSTGEPYPALDHVGINRLAFRVSDIDATTAALRAQGITFLSEKPEAFGGIKTIVTTDPDGVSFNSLNGCRVQITCPPRVIKNFYYKETTI